MKTTKVIYKREPDINGENEAFLLYQVTDYKHGFHIYICRFLKKELKVLLIKEGISSYKGRKTFTNKNNKGLYFLLRGGKSDRQQSKYN